MFPKLLRKNCYVTIVTYLVAWYGILRELLRKNSHVIIVTYLVVAWYGIFNSVCARKVSRKM